MGKGNMEAKKSTVEGQTAGDYTEKMLGMVHQLQAENEQLKHKLRESYQQEFLTRLQVLMRISENSRHYPSLMVKKALNDIEEAVFGIEEDVSESVE